MYSKFQFFPLPPCNPQAMSEIPCPSSSPSPVTVTELCLLSWGLSCHLWGHHKPLARLLSQVWSSLVTPAVSTLRHWAGSTTVPVAGGNFPFQGFSDPTILPMVTPLVTPRCPWPGAQPCAPPSREHPMPPSSWRCRALSPVKTFPFYTCLLPLETHQMLKPLSLEREPAVLPGFHLTALF